MDAALKRQSAHRTIITDVKGTTQVKFAIEAGSTISSDVNMVPIERG